MRSSPLRRPGRLEVAVVFLFVGVNLARQATTHQPRALPGYWASRADSGGSVRDTLIICAGFRESGHSEGQEI
jgi:hypothetical protein